jgi:hypothetical protein
VFWRSICGSLAMFAAIRRALSLVTSLADRPRPDCESEASHPLYDYL